MFNADTSLVIIESLGEKIRAQQNVIENVMGSNQALSEQNEILRKEIKKLKDDVPCTCPDESTDIAVAYSGMCDTAAQCIANEDD